MKHVPNSQFVGKKLRAINPCLMTNEFGRLTNKAALIVGKEYTINQHIYGLQGRTEFVIKSETDDKHYFPTENVPDYFRLVRA